MTGADLDIDEVARLAASCPSVARLATGGAVEVATYLPGRRVAGVRSTAGGIEVHVVARYGPSLPDVAEEVRAAVQPVVGDRPVAVCIDDVDLAAGPGPAMTGPP